MIKNILFDLDGTLLPMDQDEFTKVYLKTICTSMIQHGFEPKQLAGAIWEGFKKMVTNHSDKTNEEIFWNSFSKTYGEDIILKKPVFDEFYRTDFNSISSVCGISEKAQHTVEYLKNEGYNIIIATLPVFPKTAVENRLKWAGLSPDDFSYITTYENSTRCKPDPEYYSEILIKNNLSPSECIMVGNNVDEDMIAEKVGIQGFLMPECLINEHNRDISVYPQGSFDELIDFLKNNR